jgi:hypothetical protein
MSYWKKEVKKDSQFLYWYDIEGKTPLAVTISGYVTKKAFCPGKSKPGKDENGNFDDGKLDMWCLTFKRGKKALGVNITNGTLIEHLHGSDMENWVGKHIILRIAECKGEKCIRVHARGAKLSGHIPKFKYIDKEPEASE